MDPVANKSFPRPLLNCCVSFVFAGGVFADTRYGQERAMEAVASLRPELNSQVDVKALDENLRAVAAFGLNELRNAWERSAEYAQTLLGDKGAE